MLIYICLILVIAFLIYFFGIKPLMEKQSSYTENIGEYEMQYMDMSSATAGLAYDKENLEKLKSEYLVLRENFNEPMSRDKIDDMFTGYILGSHLKPLTLSISDAETTKLSSYKDLFIPPEIVYDEQGNEIPQEDIEYSQIKTTPISLTCSGTRNNMYKFVSTLSSCDDSIRIVSMNITPKNDEPSYDEIIKAMQKVYEVSEAEAILAYSEDQTIISDDLLSEELEAVMQNKTYLNDNVNVTGTFAIELYTYDYDYIEYAINNSYEDTPASEEEGEKTDDDYINSFINNPEDANDNANEAESSDTDENEDASE